MAEGEVNIKPITNVEQIVKAFKNVVDNMEKIDKKKAKFAINQLLDIKKYLANFFVFAGDISQIIKENAANIEENIIKSQSDLTGLMKSSLDLIKSVTDYKLPDIIKFKWQLWRFKRRFMMLVDLFFDTDNGVAGYLRNLDGSKRAKTVFDEKLGKEVKKKVSNFKELNDMIKNFSETVEEINDIIAKTISSTTSVLKRTTTTKIGFKLINDIFNEYYFLLNGVDLRIISYSHIQDTIQRASINILSFNKIIDSISNAFRGKTGDLLTTKLTLNLASNIVRGLIVAINNINRDENNKPIRLIDRTKMFELLLKQVEQLGEIIKNINVFNNRTLVITIIAKKTVGKILSNIKFIINKIVDFVDYLQQLSITDVSRSINNVNQIIYSILGIIGGILLLALSSAVLIISVPVALISISLIILFIKTAIWELSWIGNNKNSAQLLIATKNIVTVVAIIVGSMIIVATGIVLLAYIGVYMLVVLKPALLTFAIVSIVLLAVVGLAYLINLMLKGAVGKVIYDGVLAILAIIGSMLIIAAGLILLGMIGMALVKDHIWLYALGVIAGVALLMLAIAGLGLLLITIMPAIMASTIALLLTTIAVTAILLTAAELILLSKINFDDQMVATIKENVALVVNTALDIIGMIFKDVDEDSIIFGQKSQFVVFFKTIFKGSAVMIQALTASVLLVLTFVSVTMIILISLELMLVAKIKVDKEAVHRSVNDIMMGAEYCIDAIFGEYDEPNVKKSGKEKFGKFVDRILSGIGDILSLIFGIAKLALIIVSVSLILFVALSLKLIVLTARNMDPVEIRGAVETILGSAQYCIDTIFETPREPNENTAGLKYTSFLGKILTGIGDILTIVMGIGRLAFTLVSVAIVMFIAQSLKKIIDISKEFDRRTIEESLGVIMNCADYCRDVVWNPAGPEFVTSENNIGQKFLGFISGVFKNIGNNIGAILSIGRIASTLTAVALVVFLAEKLQLINEIANKIDKDSIQKDTIAIIETSDLIVKKINESDFESISKRKIEGLDSINMMFEKFLRLITTYKNITKEGIDLIIYALQNIIPEINKLDVNVDIKQQQKLYDNLGSFIKIINIRLEQTKEGIDLIVYAIESIIPAMNTMKIDVQTKDLLKVLGAVKEFIHIINFEFKQTKEGIDLIVYAIESVISSLNKISNLGANFDNIKRNTQTVINIIESINNHEINTEHISSIDNLADVIGKLFDAFNKNSKNAERGMNKSIEFINKVNNVKLENLKTTARLFEKMADFSESINGNFDGLADALNDKIAPLIEKLNTALKETKTTIQNSEAAIERARSASIELNAKLAEAKSVAGVGESEKKTEAETEPNYESLDISKNLRDIKKLLYGKTKSTAKGLKVQT